VKKHICLLYTASLFCFITAKAQTIQSPYAQSAATKEAAQDYKGAIEDCTKAIAYDEQDIRAYLLRATAYLHLNQSNQAMINFDNVISIAQNKLTADGTDASLISYEAISYLGKGEILQNLKNNAEAISCFDHVIALQPNNVNAYTRRALAEAALKRYNEAIADNSKLIALNSNLSSAYFNRAYALSALKRYEEAIVDNMKVLELAPQNSAARYNLGYQKSRMGRYDEAEVDLNKALDLVPHHGYALRGLGVIKYWQGDYDDAIAFYNIAIEYNNKVPDGYEFRGLAENKLGRYAEAMQDYGKAIALDPKRGYVYMCIGELQMNMADYQGAIASITKSIALDTSDKREYNSLGYAYFKAKNYPKAITYFDTAQIKGGNLFQPRFQYRDEAVKALNQKGTFQFTHLEWIGPVEDVNAMYQGTLIASKPQLTLRVKVSSTKPIIKDQIKLLVNNQPLTAANQVTLANTGNGTFNKTTGEYEYEYKANLLVANGENKIKVQYDKKSVQELMVKYNTQ
jgi:tetratricopeptide (TPR) repeat protein